MVDFNSSISKTPVYQQSSIPGQPASGRSSQTGNTTQTGFKGQEAGAVYEKTSALDSIVGEKVKNMTGSQNLGRTIGNPQLSEKAQKYYEQLKGKFGDMDFILVSNEEKANAQANAASYANPNKMVVLIDEEKIEKMATDEKFRSQYEGLISMAQTNMASMKDSLGNASEVKGYGMQVNDNGTASYFAVVKKLNDGQAERIEKKKEEKLAEKKAEKKKADKEAREEAVKNKSEDGEEINEEDIDETEEIHDLFGYSEDDRYEIISASSVEELLQKVGSYTGKNYTASDNYVGSSIDFRA